MNNITDLIQHSLNGISGELKELRQSIHANPELGYAEYNTTSLIKNFLAGNGVEFINFDNLTGGFAHIDCKKKKPYASGRTSMLYL